MTAKGPFHAQSIYKDFGHEKIPIDTVMVDTSVPDNAQTNPTTVKNLSESEPNPFCFQDKASHTVDTPFFPSTKKTPLPSGISKFKSDVATKKDNQPTVDGVKE